MDDDDVHDKGIVSTNESLLNFRMFFFFKKESKNAKIKFFFQVNIFSCFYFSIIIFQFFSYSLLFFILHIYQIFFHSSKFEIKFPLLHSVDVSSNVACTHSLSYQIMFMFTLMEEDDT